jgi:hypothetical protein
MTTFLVDPHVVGFVHHGEQPEHSENPQLND